VQYMRKGEQKSFTCRRRENSPGVRGNGALLPGDSRGGRGVGRVFRSRVGGGEERRGENRWGITGRVVPVKKADEPAGDQHIGRNFKKRGGHRFGIGRGGGGASGGGAA